MAMEAIDQIEKFQEFLEAHYLDSINAAVSKGHKSISVDFFELSKFDPDLTEILLDEPEEVIKAAEMAIEQFDLKKPLKVRFFNFPDSQKVLVRNIRSSHLNKFIAIDGIIRQTSNVRPEAVSARFECPSCGNVITLPQTESKFREPSRCTCGRKGQFRLLSKEFVDAQRIVIEESAQSLEGGAEPKRLSIFLRDDLVEPYMEKKTTPGKNVIVTGVVKEVPIPAKDGGISTRFDLIMNANSINTLEEDYTDIHISNEDVKEIKDLSKDKKIYEKLVSSVAPSIFGHDRVKEAIVLQLMGGVRKVKSDGTIIRGDIHILLVGDPGAGKSAMLSFVKNTAPKARYVAGRSSSGAGLCVAPDSIVLTNPGGMSKIKNVVEKHLEGNMKEYCEGIWQAKKTDSDVKIYTLNDKLKIEGKRPAQFWKLKGPEKMVRIKTRLGKELSITPNTKLLTINDGNVEWKKAGEFKETDFVATAGALKDVKFDSKGIKDKSLLRKKFDLANSDIFWDEIKEIYFDKDHNYEYVYDLTVEDSHNFLVNGFVVHNTATVVKDEFLRGWALEAGAIVLADRGVLVIDEMDKMTKEDTSALHEGMEQQSYHPDFEMMFSDGTLAKIGDFVDSLMLENKDKIVNGKDCEILPVDKYEVLTTDFNKVYPIKVNRVSRHKAPNYFIEVSFSNGRKIMVTPEHPFFVFKDGKYVEVGAESLIKGMQIPAPTKWPITKDSLLSNGSHLKFVQVKSIRKVANKDAKWVYDVTVEPNHAFISEGLVLHNTITIAKANIQATLRCQTTILAAANPKLGRFDPFAPIAQQIDLPPALINRFDLIFVLRDIPNRDKDAMIAHHILKHQSQKGEAAIIPPVQLRKYLTYVKQNVFPVLTDEAIEDIKQFYVSLRNTGSTGDEAIRPIPISARQLEAIVRMAEGSARIRLSDKIGTDDVKKAISLLRACLLEVGIDPETGHIDIDRIGSGISASERGKIVTVRDIIFKLDDEGKKTIPIEDIMEIARQKGITEQKVEEAIEKLKKSGDIFQPKPNFIQKI